MGSESFNAKDLASGRITPADKNLSRYASEREDSLNLKLHGENSRNKGDSSGLGDSFNNLISNRKDSIASKPDERGSVLSHNFNTRSHSTAKKLKHLNSSYTPKAKNT
jgi:hypothetical protein